MRDFYSPDLLLSSFPYYGSIIYLCTYLSTYLSIYLPTYLPIRVVPAWDFGFFKINEEGGF